jgi:hypothetical protein
MDRAMRAGLKVIAFAQFAFQAILIGTELYFLRTYFLV